MLFKKFQTWFSPQPERNHQQMAEQLDRSITENEMQLDEIKNKILALEREEQREVQQVRSQKLSPREEKFTLLQIQKLRKQIEKLEQRLHIHYRNIQMQMELLSKIKDVEAMQLTTAQSEEIEELVCHFEEEIANYIENTHVPEVIEESISWQEQEQDLQNLHAEIFADTTAKQQAPEKQPEQQLPEETQQTKKQSEPTQTLEEA